MKVIFKNKSTKIEVKQVGPIERFFVVTTGTKTIETRTFKSASGIEFTEPLKVGVSNVIKSYLKLSDLLGEHNVVRRAEIKTNDLFHKVNSQGKLSEKVFISDGYNRSTKKFESHSLSDINDLQEIDGNKLVSIY